MPSVDTTKLVVGVADDEVVEGRFEEVGDVVEERVVPDDDVAGDVVEERLVTVEGGTEDELLGFGVDAALEDGSTVEEALYIVSYQEIIQRSQTLTQHSFQIVVDTQHRTKHPYSHSGCIDCLQQINTRCSR